MNDTTTAATTWRDTDPIKGAIGRLVLKADAAVVLPVVIRDTHAGRYTVVIRGDKAGYTRSFIPAFWTFQVEQPPLPTTPGSVIRWTNDFDDSENLIVLDDRGQWGNADYAPPTSRITTWQIVSDTGPVGS